MSETRLAELALREYVRVPELKPTADGSFLRLSSITQCDRKQILDAMQIPTVNLGPDALNGFVAREIGTMMHAYIQEAFADHPDVYDFESEVPVSIPDCLTSGHADGVYLAESGERLLLEIKTMRNYGFRKARQDGPKEEHLYASMCLCVGVRAYLNTYILCMCVLTLRLLVGKTVPVLVICIEWLY